MKVSTSFENQQIKSKIFFYFEDSLIDDSIFSDGFHYLHLQKLVYHRN